MKFKSLIITLLASSIFLTIIICIWKILATLQGLSFTNLNFNLNLLLSLGLVITCVFIGKNFNHNLKIFTLSLLFTIIYSFLNESSPLWFSAGVFILILFFTNKLKLKLRLVKLIPCKVAIIVHIQIIVAKKIEDANKVIIKDLNFICLLSN